MNSLFIATLSTLPGFLIAWLLSNYFQIEDYSFFLLIQNMTIGLNLFLNFGLNTFMLRYRVNSTLNEAFGSVMLIYFAYFILVTLAAIFYYLHIFDRTVNFLNFVITITFSSMAFLMANNFQQFYIGQGRMNYAHIRFIAGPKILALVTLSLFFFWSLPFPENAAWFYFVQLVFLISAIDLFRKSCNNIPRSIDIVKANTHQWGTFLLHGIYGPLLVMFVYELDKDLVASLGVAILLSQPARMIYQFSIQTKVKMIKERILANSRVIDIRRIYLNLIVTSSALILVYAVALIFLEDLISNYLFPNIENILQFSLFFITYQMINSLFGPNGTLLALVDAAKYDAYSAFFKIIIFLLLIFLGWSIPILMVLMMFMEIAINVYKNKKLGLFTNKKLPAFLPIMLSMSLVFIEVAYFGLY
jgi:hypothetical protein